MHTHTHAHIDTHNIHTLSHTRALSLTHSLRRSVHTHTRTSSRGRANNAIRTHMGQIGRPKKASRQTQSLLTAFEKNRLYCGCEVWLPQYSCPNTRLTCGRGSPGRCRGRAAYSRCGTWHARIYAGHDATRGPRPQSHKGVLGYQCKGQEEVSQGEGQGREDTDNSCWSLRV